MLSEAHWSSLVEKEEGTAWNLAAGDVGCTEQGVRSRGTLVVEAAVVYNGTSTTTLELKCLLPQLISS